MLLALLGQQLLNLPASRVPDPIFSSSIRRTSILIENSFRNSELCVPSVRTSCTLLSRPSIRSTAFTCSPNSLPCLRSIDARSGEDHEYPRVLLACCVRSKDQDNQETIPTSSDHLYSSFLCYKRHLHELLSYNNSVSGAHTVSNVCKFLLDWGSMYFPDHCLIVALE